MNVITHNLSAMNAQRQYKAVTSARVKSTEKLSSGYRINRAADDAAGLTISEKLRSKIRALSMGEENIQDGISWCQIGDGALEEVHDMLHRMKELSIKSATSTLTDADRKAIDDETSQLKKEIDRISRSTQFNTLDIFENSGVSLSVFDKTNDLNVYNLSYDSDTNELIQGGFIFRGCRIPWDEVDPSLVTVNDSGEQVFTKGSYSYSYEDPDDGITYTFQIDCEDEEKVPTFTRIFNISSDPATGITVDGKQYAWSDLKNTDTNEALSSSTLKEGTWTLNHNGADVYFYIASDIDSMDLLSSAINDMHDASWKYTWTEEYDGVSSETAAVKTSGAQTITITDDIAHENSNGVMKFTFRADESGVWLQNSSGNDINGSKKTWDDLGISSWTEGTDIASNITYKYSDTEGTNDMDVEITFRLSDVTSVDSVIDAIDGMQYNASSIVARYNTAEFSTVTTGSNVTGGFVAGTISPTYSQELALGRDFDTPNDKVDTTDDFSISGNTVTLGFNGKGGSTDPVLSFKGNANLSVISSRITSYATNAYNAFMLNNGSSASAGSITNYRITLNGDPAGSVNGHVTLSYDYDLSDIGSKLSFAMNASDEGTYILEDTNNGANGYRSYVAYDSSSTKSYIDSISSLEATNAALNTTLSGYQAELSDLNDEKSALDLQLSGLNTTAASLASEMSALTSAATALSSDLATLQADLAAYQAEYDAEDTTDERKAELDLLIAQANADITSKNTEISDNNSAKTAKQAEIDSNALAISAKNDEITSKQAEIDSKNSQISGVSSQISANDSSISSYKESIRRITGASEGSETEPVRYDLKITYNNGSSTQDLTSDIGWKSTAANSYANEALKKMIDSTDAVLSADFASRATLNGSFNSNKAFRTNYETDVKKKPYYDPIPIQKSNDIGNITEIPKFAMNSVTLGIAGVKLDSQDSARKSMSVIDGAVNYVSSCRSRFGACQNALESAYRQNTNTRENLTAAESRMRDTDMSTEVVKLSMQTILSQVSEAMMAQANASTQGVLSILG